MRCKSVVLTLFLLISYPIAHAQTAKLDSLEQLLTNHAATDTVKINLLNTIAKVARGVDLQKNLHYAIQADSLSTILNFKKGKSESLRLIGNNYFYRNEPSKALAAFEEALEISQEIGEKTGISYSYNYIGNIYLMQGNYAKAQEYYQQALKFFKESGDKIGISGIYNNLSNIYYMQGDYPRTLAYFQKALKVFEGLNNKIGMSGSYNNIGVVYEEQGKYNKALEYYQKALKIREELGDKFDIADSYTNIGDLYESQGDYAHSFEYFQKALTINEEIDNRYGISVSNHNIGVIYMHQDNYSKSLDYFQKSMTIAEEIGSQNMIALNNIKISSVHFEQENYKLAIQFGEKGYRLAVELGEKDNIKKASEILAKCYAAVGNYPKAYQYHVEFKTQSDSLLNESNIEKITELEYEYKYEKEKELAHIEKEKNEIALKAETARQKNIRNAFIAGFAMMIALALFIFRNLALKRKANILLAEQKKEIENQAKQLQTTNEKLIALDTFKQGLTSMIVHDLKNPLNGILNVSTSYAAESQVLQMKQMGQQMLNIVLNILDVHKYEDSQMAVDKMAVSLLKISQQAASTVQFLAKQKNINLTNNINSAFYVYADSEIMERVFVNLLTNAIKYTPNNGFITLNATTDKNQNNIKVYITDTGSGIPEDKTHLVFTKFGQVFAKKSGNVRSTGLGLTFCKMAVEAHGGEITVESEINKGTTFWFTLQTAKKYEPENIPLIDLKPTENYTLSPKEKKMLAPFIDQLKKTEIYKMLELRKILKQIADDSENIKKWKKEIREAMGSGNQERYNELLNL